MKVLGKSADGYICEVSHAELEKCASKYYDGGLPFLKAGDKFDIGAGFDFRGAIATVGRETTEAITAFEKYMPLLTQFMALVGKLPTAQEPQPAARDTP